MQKFWTTNNGQIGTAHHNRNNEVVDFRSATPKLEKEGTFVFPASTGVEIEQLRLPAAQVGEWTEILPHREVSPWNLEDLRTTQVWHAQFLDTVVEVRITSTHRSHTAVAQWQAKESAREQEKKDFEQGKLDSRSHCLALINDPDALVEFGTVGNSQFSRLKGKEWENTIREIIIDLVIKLLSEYGVTDAGNCIAEYIARSIKFDSVSLRDALLVLAIRQREEQKQKFLAQKVSKPTP